MCRHHALCFVAPPNLLDYLARTGDAETRDSVMRTLAASAALRAQRSVVGRVVANTDQDVRALGFLPPPAGGQRTVYDVAHGGRSALPGTLVRGEDDPAVADAAVNEAFDGAGATYRFYRDVFGRDSVDGQGGELVSTVHYGVRFENALWNGVQMVYGDGGGRIFKEGSLTTALDVIGHELSHGVTQYTAGLVYSKQSGALNEHFSDVFGSLVKQREAGQTADQADWLIGAGILRDELGQALRSMKAPGTAWAGDSQPSTMAGYQDLPDDNDPANDNGGVHINSGIPNHAFHLAATALGGHAWERAGKVWFETLTTELEADAQFDDMASATVAVAGRLFPDDPAVESAVRDAWTAVGLLS